MSEREIADPVLRAIDDVFAILVEKDEADEDDHATDPRLDDAVGTFLSTYEEHMPRAWADDAPLAQLAYLEVYLASRGDARRAATTDLVLRWLAQRIAGTASDN